LLPFPFPSKCPRTYREKDRGEDIMNTLDKKEICNSWNVYVITDMHMAAPRSYFQIIREILMGGANVIQLRDKTTPFEELVETGRKLKPLFDEYGATFIVNDNPYLAREVDADGVHLGQEDIPVDIAREIMGKDKIIGLSTHTKQQAILAMYLDVDYIGVGPVYATSTKKQKYSPLGLKFLSWIQKEVRLPFVPIGGIQKENITDVCHSGGTAPAVISAVMKADDLTLATRELVDIISQARIS